MAVQQPPLPQSIATYQLCLQASNQVTFFPYEIRHQLMDLYPYCFWLSACQIGADECNSNHIEELSNGHEQQEEGQGESSAENEQECETEDECDVFSDMESRETRLAVVHIHAEYVPID